jgi:RsiW-degrading membrane proteinase PrsW (M82 family)
MVVNSPEEEEQAAYQFEKEPGEKEGPPPKKKIVSHRQEQEQESPARPPAKKSLRASPPYPPPLKSKETPLWLRHLHWLLALALIPLALSLLQKAEDDDVLSRLIDTMRQAPPDVRSRVEREIDKGEGSLDDLLKALPDQKLTGAFLGRRTWAHWGFAAVMAVIFMAFFMFLASDGSAEPLHLFLIGFFTATIGILLLFLFQLAAEFSQGVWIHGRSILVLIFYLVKFIGYSYRAALDPENGFFLSFMGYTLGVGLCEEVCKALPLFWHYRRPSDQTWRGAFIWGLASGAGFGLAEAILYAGSYYNGVMGPGIYPVRFISCVALHALWTGSVGITLNQRQSLIQGEMNWYEYIPPILLIVAVPMVLHGLYDTLLKKEMHAWALAAAICSFLFLAFQISRLRTGDERAATDDFLKEYKQRRLASS